MQGDAVVRLRRGVDLTVSIHAGTSPSLVFLHGGLGNRFNWRSQYDYACAQGWQALAYDLAGHGQSSPYPRYSIGRHQRDLTRLLCHFHIHSPVLCCHSYGVPIALEWAQCHPTRGLVLIAGGTHDLDPWWEIPLMTLMAWGGRHLFRLPLLQRLSRPLMSSYRTERVEQFLDESPVPTDLSSYQALRIFWNYDFFRRSKSEHCRSIPSLIISGGEDPAFTKEMGDQLAGHFHRSRHLHLPKAGHILMAEQPEVVNAAIQRLINAEVQNVGS